ncbi:MAG: bifunctional hydroxymethylpyrimidine kinase/phosphomethylpyrimidine kinase [Oscillospiraceae bacterium]|nr:bifunctional hydroxymethylpyrimidine kinase/phosphomethylpyrimidine kinase [Oscillospiraceae bacterium]
MKRNVKAVLSVAGSDSIGGAGIQADIKTISALGHYAMTAVTAVTAQNTLGVTLSEAVSPNMMRGQLDAVFEDITPDSVKIGMLANSENAEIIADRLRFYNAKNIVCDTVIMSTSGKELLSNEGLNAFINRLLPLAAVITPNIPEAERLCNMHIGSISDMERAAEILSGMTPGAVLIKGGHLRGEEAADIFRCKDKLYTFTSPRIQNPNTHGTGCTLSSAIACGLAEEKDIPEAVRYAKEYISKVIGNNFMMGHGRGSMWHFD